MLDKVVELLQKFLNWLIPEGPERKKILNAICMIMYYAFWLIVSLIIIGALKTLFSRRSETHGKRR